LTGKANRNGSGVRLRRSITILKRNSKRVIVGAKGKPAVYAGVHNFGLRAGRGKGFTMPKRQFIGPSKLLDKKIVRLLKKELKKPF
jgi:phage gpG-like protein